MKKTRHFTNKTEQKWGLALMGDTGRHMLRSIRKDSNLHSWARTNIYKISFVCDDLGGDLRKVLLQGSFLARGPAICRYSHELPKAHLS